MFGTLFRAGRRSRSPAATRWMAKASRLSSIPGLEAVLKRGGVTEGQKTMIDAIAPAARAAKRRQRRRPRRRRLRLPRRRSLEGVEATKNMIATTGKARVLGERSIGHPDPGAITTSLILKAMRDFTAKA